MSVLGTIIIILVTAGATYFGIDQFGGQNSGPLLMSPEVKTYIDAKLTGGISNSGQELQKIMGRVVEMEAKLLEMEKVRASYEQLAGKSELIESAIGDQRKRKEDIMAAARIAEMAQIRNDIATVCAGVTIKRVQSSAGKGASAEAQAFRNNIGGGKATAPARPGGGQQAPGMQNYRGGGGAAGGGRRRGGGGAGEAPGGAPGGAAGDKRP